MILAHSRPSRCLNNCSQFLLCSASNVITVGAIFFLSFCFSFSRLLVIVYSFFTLRYFVYYAPLLCAVCKFRYSLLPRPYFIASFYGAISVTTFVEVGSFFGGPDHQPCLPQHLVSSFVFIVFSFISFCSRLKVVFCIVIIIFSLFVGIYFSLWFGNSKTFADCERVVFGIGPCPFILPNWPLPVHFVWNWPLPVQCYNYFNIVSYCNYFQTTPHALCL